MNYIFVVPYQAISPTGGVKIQAEMWKNGLEKLGHNVTLADSWNIRPWSKFDAIVIFGFAPGLRTLINCLAKENPNIIIAPIIDPNMPDYIFKFFVKYWGSQKFLGLSSRFHDLWLAKHYPKLWLIRSDEERHYVNYCLEIPQEKIAKVPLHFRIPTIDYMPHKESFCFHASRLASKNKNVPRLITAAKKYGFNLKLAGYLIGESEHAWLESLIGDSTNIEYVGTLSEEKLLEFYKCAKVFALPSLQEGVGMVALEAAAYGCEIVLTKRGAPKEYYDGQALLVDPLSIDDIGKSIVKALNNGFSQPELQKYVQEKYSENSCMILLNKVISQALQ